MYPLEEDAAAWPDVCHGLSKHCSAAPVLVHIGCKLYHVHAGTHGTHWVQSVSCACWYTWYTLGAICTVCLLVHMVHIGCNLYCVHAGTHMVHITYGTHWVQSVLCACWYTWYTLGAICIMCMLVNVGATCIVCLLAWYTRYTLGATWYHVHAGKRGCNVYRVLAGTHGTHWVQSVSCACRYTCACMLVHVVHIGCNLYCVAQGVWQIHLYKGRLGSNLTLQ